MVGGFRFYYFHFCIQYKSIEIKIFKHISILIPPFTLSWKKEINIILYVMLVCWY